jgi:hypothetical protein
MKRFDNELDLNPLECVLVARRACEHRPTFISEVWDQVEAQVRDAVPRGMDPPAPDGVYTGPGKLGHEFTQVALATQSHRLPHAPGTKLCKHCGLEDWSRRRDQECPVRLRAVLSELRTTLSEREAPVNQEHDSQVAVLPEGLSEESVALLAEIAQLLGQE